MTNQCVLITAGAAGIGREIARAFAATGASIFVCDIDSAGLSVLAGEVAGLKTGICDVSKRQDIERMMSACVAALGALTSLSTTPALRAPPRLSKQWTPMNGKRSCRWT